MILRCDIISFYLEYILRCNNCGQDIGVESFTLNSGYCDKCSPLVGRSLLSSAFILCFLGIFISALTAG